MEKLYVKGKREKREGELEWKRLKKMFPNIGIV
jgi:hypothetical protein